jgi:hypothetical protein
MNHVVSLNGLGSLHHAHSTVLFGRRVISLMLNRGLRRVKDKPSVHNISQTRNLKIMMNESVCNGLSLTILRGVSRDHHNPRGGV